ncbi:MAG: iron-containing alcohol dehydrogenase [Planctomycetaceae bacterium]|nr:iron-containing alcohol dehydrogenase [Planctomycetaceae bacterium]
MIPFDFQPRTRIIFGPGSIHRLGELAGELGARRVLVVSDPGVISAGHTQKAIDSLEKGGIETHLFEEVCENPTTAEVDSGVSLAHRYEPEMIVGLGGGSAMDCAKGINFLFSNGGSMQDYWGVGKALQPMLPMIAIPTTAGTGSETQSFALISDAKTHVKMACGDKKASFRIAVLDPELTLTQPPLVTALTGIDAMAHAVETFVTNRRNPVSLAFSREAWRLISINLPRVLDHPDDMEARGGMLLGASFAGMAIENSMLGAAHALANPLTASFQIAHGQAIATMLPHVIRFNGESNPNWYQELFEITGRNNGSVSSTKRAQAGSDGLADFVTRIVSQARLPANLSSQGVTRDALPNLAKEACKQWTASFNPREVDASQLLGLYEKAFDA